MPRDVPLAMSHRSGRHCSALSTVYFQPEGGADTAPCMHRKFGALSPQFPVSGAVVLGTLLAAVTLPVVVAR